MRAAILHETGGTPTVGDFDEHFDEPGDQLVDVRLGGCNPVDLAIASGFMGAPALPSVVGQEGIGTTVDGNRVYFNSPPKPFGSWAERCRVDPALTFPVPDALDDELAVAMGIAGLAAWLPLTRHATVSNGESVLVLGATGIVGRIAVQAAKVLGAGRVVGAGRNRTALDTAGELGADATVVLGDGDGGDDDAEELQAEAGRGYDVVIDCVYGAPFLAALEATAAGATLVTIGQGAGSSADIPFRSLLGRTHIGHYNNAMPPETLRAAFSELMGHAADGRIRVESRRYFLDEAAEVWHAESQGPHVKLAVAPR